MVFYLTEDLASLKQTGGGEGGGGGDRRHAASSRGGWAKEDQRHATFLVGGDNVDELIGRRLG